MGLATTAGRHCSACLSSRAAPIARRGATAASAHLVPGRPCLQRCQLQFEGPVEQPLLEGCVLLNLAMGPSRAAVSMLPQCCTHSLWLQPGGWSCPIHFKRHMLCGRLRSDCRAREAATADRLALSMMVTSKRSSTRGTEQKMVGWQARMSAGMPLASPLLLGRTHPR